ncbi:MAG: hypothetical protein E4H13_03060 [Calditrichales bacterium]|nr:MAG: hypothetical protein E4H13_03060 [Calditrichales bacterium]
MLKNILLYFLKFDIGIYCCMIKKNIIFIILLSLPLVASAQTVLEKNVLDILQNTEKGEAYLNGYLQPMVTAFGTVLGGGLYHRADTKTFPHFDIAVNAVNVIIPDKAKSFNTSGHNVPTVFGSKETNLLATPGIDLTRLDIPFIQLNLGLSGEFEMMFRGWPKFYLADIGQARYYGVGVKYGLSDLVDSPTFPLNMSVQGAYHLMRIDGWLTIGTFGMNILWSRKLDILPLGIYGGVGYDVTSTNVYTDKVTGNAENSSRELKLKGLNGIRANLGLSFTISIFTINADYNFSYYHSIAAGFIIGL